MKLKDTIYNIIETICRVFITIILCYHTPIECVGILKYYIIIILSIWIFIPISKNLTYKPKPKEIGLKQILHLENKNIRGMIDNNEKNNR